MAEHLEELIADFHDNLLTVLQKIPHGSWLIYKNIISVWNKDQE